MEVVETLNAAFEGGDGGGEIRGERRVAAAKGGDLRRESGGEVVELGLEGLKGGFRAGRRRRRSRARVEGEIVTDLL